MTDLENEFEAAVEAALSEWIPVRDAYFERARRFALDRILEGQAIRDFLASRLGRRRARILDLGAGNGGVSFGVATSAELKVTALDIIPNHTLRQVRSRTASNVRQVVGRGEQLPFMDSSFEVVLCLDSFEHFTEPGLIGAEIMRVVTPGGFCLLKTPARFKYLFRPDPHCGLRGLLVLPDAAQRFLVNRVLRWPVFYDVHHTYWHAGELLRHFPGRGGVELLWNRDFPGTDWLRDLLWYRHRNFVWDSMTIYKAGPVDHGKGDVWHCLPFPLAETAD